jgi:hypothetical protein
MHSGLPLFVVYHHIFERIFFNLCHHGLHCLQKGFNPIITGNPLRLIGVDGPFDQKTYFEMYKNSKTWIYIGTFYA